MPLKVIEEKKEKIKGIAFISFLSRCHIPNPMVSNIQIRQLTSKWRHIYRISLQITWLWSHQTKAQPSCAVSTLTANHVWLCRGHSADRVKPLRPWLTETCPCIRTPVNRSSQSRTPRTQTVGSTVATWRVISSHLCHDVQIWQCFLPPMYLNWSCSLPRCLWIYPIRLSWGAPLKNRSHLPLLGLPVFCFKSSRYINFTKIIRNSPIFLLPNYISKTKLLFTFLKQNS